MRTAAKRTIAILSLALSLSNEFCDRTAGAKPTTNTQHRSAEFKPFVAYGASATSQDLVTVRFSVCDGRLAADVVQREPLRCEGAPVIYHHRHRLVYVASLRAKKGGQNRLVIFSVGHDGRLTRRNSLPMKHGSAYVSLDRSGQFLLTASYFEGHVDVYRLTNGGTSVEFVSTTFEDRDKAHSILTSPNNRFAYVPYVKDNNGMFQYAFDARGGQLKPLDPPQAEVPDDAGPRHVAFHPTRPFVFFSNEQQLGATSYRIGESGQLTLVQVCKPGELKPGNGLAGSDLVITPDGKHLFVAVRDFGNGGGHAIHRYQVHDNGRLAHRGTTTADAIPWGLQISPDGRHLLVTAAHGETLTAFEIIGDGNLMERISIKWGKMIRDIAVVVLDR